MGTQFIFFENITGKRPKDRHPTNILIAIEDDLLKIVQIHLKTTTMAALRNNTMNNSQSFLEPKIFSEFQQSFGRNSMLSTFTNSSKAVSYITSTYLVCPDSGPSLYKHMELSIKSFNENSNRKSFMRFRKLLSLLDINQDNLKKNVIFTVRELLDALDILFHHGNQESGSYCIEKEIPPFTTNNP